MTLPSVPASVAALAHSVHALGGRAFLVGGSVRDHLTGQPIKDWDIEVFGVPPDDLLRALRRHGHVSAVGRSFGVYKLRPRNEGLELDVSIPRRDSKVGPGHRGIAVEGDPEMPIAEAARRRDLTINAILVDLASGECLDPYDGRRDLASRTLRAVDQTTFLEDPLRALRVVQFAARLEFRPDPELVSLCRAAPLDELPAERIQGEWGKLLLKSQRPSMGLQVARDTSILTRAFPEAAPFDRPSHDLALDQLARLRDALEPEGRRWALMLAGWLHDAPADAVEATLDRLWIHKTKGYPVREKVLAAIRHAHAPHATDADLRHLSTVAEPALVLRVAMAFGSATASNALLRADALGVSEDPPEPLLKGRHLRGLPIPPGPEMGALLLRVYQLQLDGLVSTTEEALATARSFSSP